MALNGRRGGGRVFSAGPLAGGAGAALVMLGLFVLGFLMEFTESPGNMQVALYIGAILLLLVGFVLAAPTTVSIPEDGGALSRAWVGLISWTLAERCAVAGLAVLDDGPQAGGSGAGSQAHRIRLELRTTDGQRVELESTTDRLRLERLAAQLAGELAIPIVDGSGAPLWDAQSQEWLDGRSAPGPATGCGPCGEEGAPLPQPSQYVHVTEEEGQVVVTVECEPDPKRGDGLVLGAILGLAVSIVDVAYHVLDHPQRWWAFTADPHFWVGLVVGVGLGVHRARMRPLIKTVVFRATPDELLVATGGGSPLRLAVADIRTIDCFGSGDSFLEEGNGPARYLGIGTRSGGIIRIEGLREAALNAVPSRVRWLIHAAGKGGLR